MGASATGRLTYSGAMSALSRRWFGLRGATRPAPGRRRRGANGFRGRALLVTLALVFGWYLSGDFPVATTSGQGTCTSATVIAHGRGHALLLKDCNVLLSIRDTLAGGGSLDWDADQPIEQWEGITVGGTPARVTGIRIVSGDLSGTIPAGIAGLSGLEVLQLPINNLKGALPSEVGDLSRLRDLGLHGNALTGEIPPSLGNLTRLTSLNLSTNSLSGPIPAQLGGLGGLTWLSLAYNQLSGPIPGTIGGLWSLESLQLQNNALSGELPKNWASSPGFTRSSCRATTSRGRFPTQ